MKRPSIYFDCDRCDRRFDPQEGGVCAECRRILCGEHLYGSFFRRWIAGFGARTVCTQCRAGLTRPDEAP